MSSKINVVFFSTDSYGLEFLQALYSSSKISVKYVVTKVDKKVGRGERLQQNIIAKKADDLGIEVVKVTSLLKNPSQLSSIDWSDVDYSVVVSFGFIIPDNILNFLPHKFINVHPSLLPKYRGPSPIQTTLLNGDASTGNTIMELDNGMDTGPILAQSKVKVGENDTVIDLSQELIKDGKTLLLKTLVEHHQGSVTPKNQDNNKASITKKLVKQDGCVTLNENSTEIYNKYRALYIWPTLYTNVKYLEEFLGIRTKIANKGEIIKLKDLMLDSNKKLNIKAIQLPGKPVVKIADFINGYSVGNTLKH
jgi:methionyl-tRNA formyltransferase